MRKFLIIVFILVSVSLVIAGQYDYPQPEIKYDMENVLKQMKRFQNEYKKNGRKKQPQLVYLYSDSMPASTLRSIFKDAKKIKSIKFTGCVRGFIGKTSADLKKYMRKQVKKAKIDNIPVRMDPFFFKDLKVKRVPALVYAKCTTYPTKCDYKYIIYGDSKLSYLVEQIYNASGNQLVGQVLKELEGQI
ncbi:TrbC family F-type conjugative pilus assembly protein [Flexistipes sp.]|uniref:TrbC family F-type conjugative pilus assembly protein n=1 Tax=Flexistipes sp. TaxID=3088135 RepID=UPI002E2118CA|nr:TrbC family F-type conjugative pilus assembly protein [Flexistipes sp.]